jgi:hypothetical protein
MNLKPDFVATISKNIKEIEKRTSLVAKTQQKKPSSTKNSSKNNLQQTLDNISKDKTFFDYIASAIGYKEVISWIAKKTNILDVNPDSAQKTDKENEIYEFDEFRTFYLFKEIFTEIYEYQVQDFLDLFETKLSCKVTSVELYLIIAYVASTESFQQIDFLYIFGETIFNALSGGQPVISIPKLKSFGKLLGINERKIMNTLRDLNLKEETVTFEEFEMVFFSAFEELENTFGRSLVTGNYFQKKDNKNSTCKSGCSIF